MKTTMGWIYVEKVQFQFLCHVIVSKRFYERGIPNVHFSFNSASMSYSHTHKRARTLSDVSLPVISINSTWILGDALLQYAFLLLPNVLRSMVVAYIHVPLEEAVATNDMDLVMWVITDYWFRAGSPRHELKDAITKSLSIMNVDIFHHLMCLNQLAGRNYFSCTWINQILRNRDIPAALAYRLLKSIHDCCHFDRHDVRPLYFDALRLFNERNPVLHYGTGAENPIDVAMARMFVFHNF
jgi:hypothetical protein